VREAARGKTVTISDRRRQPVARLVPVARSADDEILDRLAPRASRLAARSVLQRGIGKPVPKPIRPRKERRKLSDLVIEDCG
jgi:antitoxin (DNA-binding transcriptional repressor) of toxin-antitoxin stability system